MISAQNLVSVLYCPSRATDLVTVNHILWTDCQYYKITVNYEDRIWVLVLPAEHSFNLTKLSMKALFQNNVN
jgi:hypothetical protein